MNVIKRALGIAESPKLYSCGSTCSAVFLQSLDHNEETNLIPYYDDN